MKKKCFKLFCLSICCFYGEKNSRFRAKLKKKTSNFAPLFVVFSFVVVLAISMHITNSHNMNFIDNNADFIGNV